MARIRKSDIEEVRSRTNIADIVQDHVTLRSAGVGSMKGLCPFHDERTPSFHIRPALGHYHCFGCGESGDVYSFLMKLDHVTFGEAVERLAARIGYTLTYEDGQAQQDGSKRLRLLQANREAESFFRAQLATPEAGAGQAFLGGRGFDGAAAERFGVGYAPKSWDAVKSHLLGKGFTDQELRDAGLVSVGDRGSSYDRFRGRVVWPIRDTTGQTLGFGARKLFDDDQGPKYLNTPETAIYHKQRVLYGIDLAKRRIARDQQVVVVEGYTDVMAAQLAGVETAVATCGTAFGVEHIKLLRRILDDESGRGRVTFTFDPDEAGQKAAMKAFEEERRFTAQTFVAVAPAGLDPCDLRLEKGDAAVRELVEHAVPMYEFVIRRHLASHDLDTVEGRVAALRQAAPVVAGIRDPAVRPGYARQLARWLGLDLPTVEEAVQRAARAPKPSRGDRAGERGSGRSSGPERPETRRAPAPGIRLAAPPDDFEPPPDDAYGGAPDAYAAPGIGANDDGAVALPQVRLHDLGRDPVTRLEQEAIMSLLQAPEALSPPQLDRVLAAEFATPALGTVRDGITATRDGIGEDGWLERLTDEVPSNFRGLVSELAMLPLPIAGEEERVAKYVRSIAAALVERDLLRRKAELLGALQRTDAAADPDRYAELQRALVEVEATKRALRNEG